MTHLARIAARIFNVPLMIEAETIVTIAGALAERLNIEPLSAIEDPTIEASRFRGAPRGPTRPDGSQENYYRADNGIALIPVLGELVNRGAWVNASSGLVSYEGLDAQLRAAAADPSIRGIVLDLNSPGGEAAGAFETASLVRRITADKPVIAFVNGMAASAAYAVASGASRIITISSGILGSIGVVMVHMDRSQAIERAGVKPTLITAGAYKGDGASTRALSDGARARLQAHVDETYALFVATVASYRNLDPDAVRATEGGVLIGQSAVNAGLADSVGTLDDVIASLNQIRSSAGQYGVFSMTTQIDAAVQPETITRAEHEILLAAAVATARTASHAEGREVGIKAGSEAERVRVKAILTSKEAEGREASALHLALSTALAVEDAQLALAGLVIPVAAAPQSRMANTPRPAVRPGSDEPADPQATADAMWGGIVTKLNAKFSSPSA